MDENINLIKDRERYALEAGEVYGGVQIIDYAGYTTMKMKNGYGKEYDGKLHYWNIRCLVCGNVKPMQEWRIKSKKLKSCGCLQQSGLKNNPSERKIINWGGVNYDMPELSDHFGLDNKFVTDRINKSGMSLEDALFMPRIENAYFKNGNKVATKNYKDYMDEHGHYYRIPNTVNPFVSTKYEGLDTNDPKYKELNWNQDELAKVRGYNPLLQETEEEYQKAREAAKRALIEKLKNQ